MRIKRYFCSDMRHAIRKIREEMGPDAVILSNRELDDGVEITAAVDYDEAWVNAARGNAGAKPLPPQAPAGGQPACAAHTEHDGPGPRPCTPDPGDASDAPRDVLAAMGEELRTLRTMVEGQLSGLAWGDLARRHPVRAGVFRRLLDLGLGQRLAREICERIKPGTSDARAAWRLALGVLAHRIRMFDKDILSAGGVVALLGPTGVGKTTTVAKLAARFALRHGASRVALITTDSYRVGAHEQLRTFAQIMGIPVRVADDLAALRGALEHYADRRLVLIDTAGTSQRDRRLRQQIALVREGSPRLMMFLVLSATAQHLAQVEAARAFAGTRPDACVITKIDEAASLGGVLSTLCEQELPAAYVSNGQRVPEDLASARAHLLVTRALGLARSRAEPAHEDEWSELAYGGLEANAGY